MESFEIIIGVVLGFMLMTLIIGFGQAYAQSTSGQLSISVQVVRTDQPMKKELKYQVIDKKDNSGYSVVEYYY